ncbi:unnamed protein product [Mycena citricolor]|uniref:Inosine/uridine-preferring nucleoside hydrolase domain-containing protein n=1 Tax=Mycena citricolor TaxID=2018698 RepID=A0AAD2K881_9AGAR|nr:unnamed protein product [Mycena citricolor]
MVGLNGVVSTDPGVDDIVAILLAIASPELEILGFITSFGNTDIESSHLNILKAYQAISRHIERLPADAARFPNFSAASKPFLARGSAGPLEGEIHSAQYFHGRRVCLTSLRAQPVMIFRDGLGDITKRHPELDLDPEYAASQQSYLTVTDRPGVDVAAELIESRPPRTVTFLALGPLTDLSCLMSRYGATIRDRIGRIVCMGGALDVPGNTTPVAEFNFFADPFAVKNLLVEGKETDDLLLPLDRFLLLPLDITTPHELPFPFYAEQVDQQFEDPTQMPVSPVVHFTSAFLRQTRKIMLEFGKDAMELHDIVAVWCAIENPPVPDGMPNRLGANWKACRRLFDIERTGELTRGFLVVDRREDASAYAPGANRAETQAELEKLGTNHRMLESTALPAQVETESKLEDGHGSGVLCVHETPGPAALLRLLAHRVWGVPHP